jgi:peptidoglycan/xylan/chitin deacetylase (PgdA/CDA1 family)
LLVFASAIAVFAFASDARAEGVALTFDDLPTLALTADAPYARKTTTALLAGLRRHGAPATGFVIGERLEGDGGSEGTRLVKAWRDAGMELGNHTYSHTSLNRTPVADYIAEVEHTDRILRALPAARGVPPRWFRHPFLETGETLEARTTFESWLAAHGYRVAPVTLENSDFVFALPYDDAVLRNDTVAATRIRRAYLDHTAKVIAWYRAAAFQLLGRRPPLVFLLHATRLNADALKDLAVILQRNNLHPISLDRAMKDTAYKIADAYAGPDGDEWLSRWARTLHKDLPWESFPEPPADIIAENERLDTSP